MTISISYHGLSCFSIEAKGIDGGRLTIITDPYNTKGTGLRLPRTLAGEVVTISNKNNEFHNNVSAINKPEMIIDEPGEYEKGGAFIYGIFSKTEEDEKTEDTIIYRYEFGDISIAHLGDLTHKLTDEEFLRLENVDILLVPVGNSEKTINYKAAVDIANQVEARIVIPMHYAMAGLSKELEGVDKFLKEYGVKEERMNKLKIARKDMPQEDTKVVVLEKG